MLVTIAVHSIADIAAPNEDITIDSTAAITACIAVEDNCWTRPIASGMEPIEEFEAFDSFKAFETFDSIETFETFVKFETF